MTAIGSLCTCPHSAALQLNWATDSSRSLSGHSNKGGLQLNAVTGGTAMAEADKELFVQVGSHASYVLTLFVETYQTCQNAYTASIKAP